MKDQTDKIILESLNYSKRMLVSTISVILLIIGISLIISPLFLASQSYIWILGLAIVAITILYIHIRKRRDSMKATNKVYYLTAIALQGIALILEVLPIGTVMVFATSPTERVIVLFKFDKSTKFKKAVFICSIVSLLFSIVPLFLFGTVGMTAASYAVSGAILLSICLQAVANRQE